MQENSEFLATSWASWFTTHPVSSGTRSFPAPPVRTSFLPAISPSSSSSGGKIHPWESAPMLHPRPQLETSVFPGGLPLSYGEEGRPSMSRTPRPSSFPVTGSFSRGGHSTSKCLSSFLLHTKQPPGQTQTQTSTVSEDPAPPLRTSPSPRAPLRPSPSPRTSRAARRRRTAFYLDCSLDEPYGTALRVNAPGYDHAADGLTNLCAYYKDLWGKKKIVESLFFAHPMCANKVRGQDRVHFLRKQFFGKSAQYFVVV